MPTISRTLIGAAAAAALAVVALTGCASTPAPAETTATQAAGITVTDAWVKAVDDGMTAAFGVVENAGAEDATIVSASSAASPMIELHETVMKDGAMTMQPVEGGFTIPAGGSFPLEPGASHIMFMGVSEPLKPGDEVDVTLDFADGSTTTFTAVVKEFTGADETYSG